VIDLSHSANRGIVNYLKSRPTKVSQPQSDPADVDDPSYTLGSHPDIVARLWDELGAALPQKCKWILYGTPVLAHPRTGVVFGFASGSLTYAIRLPPATRDAAIAAGALTRHDYPAYPELGLPASSLDLATFGDGWIFGNWLPGEMEWCVSAFEHAGQAS
jgi:hypothetical protein